MSLPPEESGASRGYKAALQTLFAKSIARADDILGKSKGFFAGIV